MCVHVCVYTYSACSWRSTGLGLVECVLLCECSRGILGGTLETARWDMGSTVNERCLGVGVW